jgi:hypothetical protein
LNRNRIHPCLHFCTVDNGEAIRWSAASHPGDATTSTTTKLP